MDMWTATARALASATDKLLRDILAVAVAASILLCPDAHCPPSSAKFASERTKCYITHCLPCPPRWRPEPGSAHPRVTLAQSSSLASSLAQMACGTASSGMIPRAGATTASRTGNATSAAGASLFLRSPCQCNQHHSKHTGCRIFHTPISLLDFRPLLLDRARDQVFRSRAWFGHSRNSCPWIFQWCYRGGSSRP